jgi:outer membrane protein assembly factor BamB
MKKILIYLGLIVVLLALVGILNLGSWSFLGFIFAEEKVEEDITTSPKETVEKPEIELVPVYEKTFDEPFVDVIFDTATVKLEEAKKMGWKEELEEAKKMGWKEEGFTVEERKKERGKVVYPRVMFNGKLTSVNIYLRQAKFYDPEGNLIRKISGESQFIEKLISSPKGEYILSAPEPDESKPELQGGVVFRKDGKEIWRRVDGGYFVTVSDEGYVVAVSDWGWEGIPPGDFIFYDASGNEKGRVKNPFKERGGAYSWSRFSKSGKNNILGFTSGSEAVIILTTREGEVLWNTKIDGDLLFYQGFQGVGVMGMVRHRRLFFIDWHGNLKWIQEGEWGGISDIKISEDREKAMVSTWQGALWCLDLNLGEVYWKYKVELPTGTKTRTRIRNIEIVEDNAYIHAYRRKEWHPSTIFVFNIKEGWMIKKIDYKSKHVLLRSFGNKIFIVEPDGGKVSGFVTQEKQK